MSANRQQFGSRLGFVLAAAGSAVGIGNLVGFPVNAAKNGGGAFLFIYAIFVVSLCLPVMLAELTLGRHTQRNPIGAFQAVVPDKKLWHIGGWLAVITPFMIAVFYMVITVWVVGYLIGAVTGNLDALADPGYFGTFINQSSVFGYFLLAAAIIGTILYLGVAAGIERAAKTMMPALFLMLIGLVIFVLTLEDAGKGVVYYLIPDFSKITPAVINGALGQAFFSLSLGMGILITFGSYMNRNESIPSAAKFVALTDTGVAFCAGLMIIPAIFAFNPAINTEELSSSSVSLIFSFLPKIFLALQTGIGYLGASIVASVFFLLVLFAAITSQVSILQVPLSALEDQLSLSRGKALLTLGLAAGVLSIFCTLSFGMVEFFTQFTSYGGFDKSFFDVVIDVFYDTILPLNGALVCLLVIYKWHKLNFDAEIERGDLDFHGTWLERYVDLALGTFIPVILTLIFLNTVAVKFFGYNVFG